MHSEEFISVLFIGLLVHGTSTPHRRRPWFLYVNMYMAVLLDLYSLFVLLL